MWQIEKRTGHINHISRTEKLEIGKLKQQQIKTKNGNTRFLMLFCFGSLQLLCDYSLTYLLFKLQKKKKITELRTSSVPINYVGGCAGGHYNRHSTIHKSAHVSLCSNLTNIKKQTKLQTRANDDYSRM